MLASISGAVTLLGSSALLLPLSILFGAVLWRQHSASLAVRWLVVLGVCLTGMAGLKLYGHACGLPVLLHRVVSPSGHAAFAALFYGALALLVARAAEGFWRRAAVLLLAGGLAAGVGLTRLVLHAHTKLEVLIGLTVGGLAALAFALSAAGLPPARLRLHPAVAVLALACGVAVAVFGDQSVIEATIRAVADDLRSAIALCVPEGSGVATLGMPDAPR